MIFAGQIKEHREVTFETLADIPVIPNALAQVSCDVVTEYIEGDHTLFIGKVRIFVYKMESHYCSLQGNIAH